METIWIIQKAADTGKWWLAPSSWQSTCSCIRSHAEFFGKTLNHPSDSATPHNPYSPDLMPWDIWCFPKLNHLWKRRNFRLQMRFRKIQWSSWWENCVRSQGAYFERDWNIIILCTMFLVSYIFFSKCLCFFFILHGWISSGQTLYICQVHVFCPSTRQPNMGFWKSPYLYLFVWHVHSG